MTGAPVRVLFVVPTLTFGGAERVMVTLLRHLDRTRIRPALAIVDGAGADYLEDLPSDVEVFDLGCRRVRHAVPGLVRQVYRWRPKVVFSTLGYMNLLLALVKPLLPGGIRFIGREGSILSHNLWDRRFPALWLGAFRRFYPRFDVVVCQSGAMRDDLASAIGMPARKMTLIHNPLDCDRVRSLAGAAAEVGMRRRGLGGAGPLELVAAGRFSQEKGFDLLIEAMALTRDVNARLTLVGDGPLRTDLQALAIRAGVADRVRFAGFQKNPYPYFAHADAYILSSRYEAFPNVVLEALACGTPVIATPAVGGIAEIARLAGGVQIASAVAADALAAELRAFDRGGSRAGASSLAAFSVERIVAQYQAVLAGDDMAAAA